MNANPSVSCRSVRSIAILAVLLWLPVIGFLAGRWNRSGMPDENGLLMSPLQIDATATASSEEFSMATGAVGKNAEGLFVLDHASGLLQCSVMYPRAGRFGALFSVNVKETLPGGGKGGGYLLVTGFANFPGGSNQPFNPGAVAYVLDTSTGSYVCYGVPFDRVAENSNRLQKRPMVVLGTGQARQIIDRDAQR